MLILYIAYLTKLHYDERRGLYESLGIDTHTDKDNKPQGKIKNHIKNRIKELEKQGGE